MSIPIPVFLILFLVADKHRHADPHQECSKTELSVEEDDASTPRLEPRIGLLGLLANRQQAYSPFWSNRT